jgi:hypothetical protein
MNLTLTLTLTLILISVAACGLEDQVSSPVPQPVPGLVRQSSPALTQTEKLVLGLPKAVAGEGKVHLTDRTSGRKVVADSTAEGTFSMVIEVDPKQDNLELQFENEDGLSDPVSISLRTLGDGPSLGQPKDGLVLPTNGPTVQVSNDAGHGTPLLLDATPDMIVIVTVTKTGQVVTSTTDSTGRFSVTVEAASGDWIQILLVDPQDPGTTSDFVTVQVP